MYERSTAFIRLWYFGPSFRNHSRISPSTRSEIGIFSGVTSTASSQKLDGNSRSSAGAVRWIVASVTWRKRSRSAQCLDKCHRTSRRQSRSMGWCFGQRRHAIRTCTEPWRSRDTRRSLPPSPSYRTSTGIGSSIRQRQSSQELHVRSYGRPQFPHVADHTQSGDSARTPAWNRSNAQAAVLYPQ